MPLTKEKTGPASSGLLITTDGHDVTRRPIITAGVISVGTVEIFLHRNRMHQLFNKERHKRNTFVTVIDYNRRLRRPSDFIRLGLFWKWDSILWLRGGGRWMVGDLLKVITLVPSDFIRLDFENIRLYHTSLSDLVGFALITWPHQTNHWKKSDIIPDAIRPYQTSALKNKDLSDLISLFSLKIKTYQTSSNLNPEKMKTYQTLSDFPP